MSGPTDSTKFAANIWRVGIVTTPIIELLDHLDAMADYAIGIGETNAAAAGTARDLIYHLIDRVDDLELDVASQFGAGLIHPTSAIDAQCGLVIR
jgi:hypothetical protein